MAWPDRCRRRPARPADLRREPRSRSDGGGGRRGTSQPGDVPGAGAVVGLLFLGDLEVGAAVATEAGQVAEVGGEVAQGEADAAQLPELPDVDQLVRDEPRGAVRGLV